MRAVQVGIFEDIKFAHGWGCRELRTRRSLRLRRGTRRLFVEFEKCYSICADVFDEFGLADDVLLVEL